MSADIFVSVIVPVYKVEAYLGRCVQSILSQTYGNFELILVDDGSPDRCPAICDEYAGKDSRIRVLHKTNGGLSDARNAGVQISNGSYIAFIDSDDYVSADYLEYLVSLLTENQAEISLCSCIRNAGDTADFSGRDARFEDVHVYSGKEICKLITIGKYHAPIVAAWASLIEAELVRKYPYPVGEKNEDLMTTYKYYYDCSRIALGNRMLYAYYNNASGIMAGIRSKYEGVNPYYEKGWVQQIAYYQEKHEYELSDTVLEKLMWLYVVDSIEGNGRSDDKLRGLRKYKAYNRKLSIMLGICRFSPRLFCNLKRLKDSLGKGDKQ